MTCFLVDTRGVEGQDIGNKVRDSSVLSLNLARSQLQMRTQLSVLCDSLVMF